MIPPPYATEALSRFRFLPPPIPSVSRPSSKRLRLKPETSSQLGPTEQPLPIGDANRPLGSWESPLGSLAHSWEMPPVLSEPLPPPAAISPSAGRCFKQGLASFGLQQGRESPRTVNSVTYGNKGALSSGTQAGMPRGAALEGYAPCRTLLHMCTAGSTDSTAAAALGLQVEP